MDLAGPSWIGPFLGLDGGVFPEASIGFLEDLSAVQVAPIISVSCNFPINLKVKGGDLVVFRSTRVPSSKGEVCCCDDPSAQGAAVNKVERTRFWSSFSERALILKSAKAR